MTSKILIYDIETAPNLGYIWGKYEQDVIEYTSEWYVLSFAYKWYGEKKTYVRSLRMYKGYKAGVEDDSLLVKELRDLLDKADFAIAHNGDKFDIKKINTRILVNNIDTPSPYRTIDTLKIARSNFAFNSNKLDDLGQTLALGRKEKHAGFQTWKGCMFGDSAAWATMEKYNIKDVMLLEKLYERIRGWDKSATNLNTPIRQLGACPKCGSQRLQHRGFNYTLTSEAPRLHCQSCGKWSQGKKEPLAVKINVT